MEIQVVSTINTLITKKYLQEQKENQYFERKGFGEKDIKPTKIAEELIGMCKVSLGYWWCFGIWDFG